MPCRSLVFTLAEIGMQADGGADETNDSAESGSTGARKYPFSRDCRTEREEAAEAGALPVDICEHREVGRTVHLKIERGGKVLPPGSGFSMRGEVPAVAALPVAAVAWKKRTWWRAGNC